MSFCLMTSGSITQVAMTVPKLNTNISSAGPWMSTNTVFPMSPDVLQISKYPIIEINDASNQSVVSIMSDGSVNISDKASNNEAAQHFWKAIRKMNPFENEAKIYKAYIRELERENNELKARIRGETVVGSHLDDDGEGTR